MELIFHPVFVTSVTNGLQTAQWLHVAVELGCASRSISDVAY